MKNIWLRLDNIRRSSLSYIATPPNLREQGRSSAVAARTNKVDSYHRALLNFKVVAFVTHYNGAIAGVYRQLSNAYLNCSNANVLPSANILFLARLATRLTQQVEPESRNGRLDAAATPPAETRSVSGTTPSAWKEVSFVLK
jgi:hypothetical protein